MIIIIIIEQSNEWFPYIICIMIIIIIIIIIIIEQSNEWFRFIIIIMIIIIEQ